MLLKRSLWVALAALVLLPGVARADFLFTPYAGMTFSKDASGHEHAMYGASLGWMGAGVAGAEIDFGYSPNFFEPKNCTNCGTFTGSNNVLDVMVNAIIGVPLGGTHGGGVRPYVTGGVGLLRQQVPASTEALKISANDFGFNFGFGLMGFATDHFGVRGDVRYLRSFQSNDSTTLGVIPTFTPGNFDFWRWSVGVILR